jgi:hypothetical protein
MTDNCRKKRRRILDDLQEVESLCEHTSLVKGATGFARNDYLLRDATHELQRMNDEQALSDFIALLDKMREDAANGDALRKLPVGFGVRRIGEMEWEVCCNVQGIVSYGNGETPAAAVKDALSRIESLSADDLKNVLENL